LGVTLVVTVVVAVALGPLVTIVFVVFEPELVLVFVVWATAGAESRPSAVSDAIKAFIGHPPYSPHASGGIEFV
jgi:hypothetical protein